MQKTNKIKLLIKVREIIVNNKLWVQRTMSWMAIANSGMILFLVLAKLQDYGIKINITLWFIPIYLGVIVLMTFLGYLEDKVGIFKEEIRSAASRNPYWDKTFERLDRIEKKIDEKWKS